MTYKIVSKSKKDTVIIVLIHHRPDARELLRFCLNKNIGFVLQNVYL